MKPAHDRSGQTYPQQPMTSGSVPRTVVALGMVSLFMDPSSEIIHSLLPAFLVTVLGVSALSVFAR